MIFIGFFGFLGLGHGFSNIVQDSIKSNWPWIYLSLYSPSYWTFFFCSFLIYFLGFNVTQSIMHKFFCR